MSLLIVDIDFPIPTYVILKDETLSPELKENFMGMPNVTVVTDVDYIQYKELTVWDVSSFYL